MPAATDVAGLPLLRRIVLAATRAGFERVLVQPPDRAAARLLQGTAATGLAGAEAPSGPRRIVVLAADVVPQPQWLRGLLAIPLEPGTVHSDGTTVAMIDSDDPGHALKIVEAARDAAAMVGALRASFPSIEGALAPAGRFRLTRVEDVPRAEAWLLRSLIKDNEGFMSRHFERRLSLALTRRLVTTGITPNTMTVVSLAIGVAAAPFFLSAAPGWQLTGALLFLLHSILDGCDGELARLKFLESPAGAVLDFWGDNLVHVAVFGCLAVGWARATGTAWPLLVGAVSMLSTLAAALLLSRVTMGDVPIAPGSPGGRLAGALAHRDFIYLVVGLAAFGRAFWFLPLSAAGTPLFLALVLWTGGARRQAAPAS